MDARATDIDSMHRHRITIFCTIKSYTAPEKQITQSTIECDHTVQPNPVTKCSKLVYGHSLPWHILLCFHNGSLPDRNTHNKTKLRNHWLSQSKSVFFKSHQNASLELIIPNYPLDMNKISLSNKAEGVNKSECDGNGGF